MAEQPSVSRPVTIRLPKDLISALNRATIDAGRLSASEMVRTILYQYLEEKGYMSDAPQ